MDKLVVSTCKQLRSRLAAVREQGRSIGLVPTMGALHEGHLSLVRAARKRCDFTVATIFVNPTQFGPNEDFERYPRTLDADLALLQREQTDLVFAPSRNEMYDADHQTYVDVEGLTTVLEGAIRPGHFRGVTTIVLKLFNLVQPKVAVFGQKDFQQATVIKRLVRDLNVPVEIDVQPTVREADGLAMSSRNRYLSAEDRRRALGLSRALQAAQRLFAEGEPSTERLVSAMWSALSESGVDQIDYAVVCDAESLAPLERIESRGVALIAARAGTTRLIDNELLQPANANARAAAGSKEGN
jgi:pantoate--beta-alanine ligase